MTRRLAVFGIYSDLLALYFHALDKRVIASMGTIV
jgi:hypothetical protein